MQMHFFFKHMETSPALQDYAKDKLLEKIGRFVNKPVDAHIVFSVEGGDHHVHCTVKGGDGFNIEVNATSADMYASVDLSVDKVVAQLKKQKEKIKHHKGNSNVRNFVDYVGKKKSTEGAPDFVDAEDILKYEATRKKLRG
jgi:putative sigma-54 modulation protein